LEKLQFAVLGLGDKNYSDFCGASRKFDSRLEALGANRLVLRGECDVDYEVTAKAWMESLWPKLGSAAEPFLSNGSQHGFHSVNGVSKEISIAYSKSNPFPARVLKNVLLSKPASGKEIRHYEICLDGSGFTYEVGDALGVLPENCPELVDRIITSGGYVAEEAVTLGETSIPLRAALTAHLDITKPSQELLAAVASRIGGNELTPLLSPERREDLKKWLWGRDILDLLEMVPRSIPAADLVRLLRKLAPRLYSISSSPKAHPGEVHLTVSTVRYKSYGRGRTGVASTFLADRVGEGGLVKVFAQPSHGFKPPTQGDTPMIMVGPGTGIAPFRAFLEERQVTGAKGKNWLFFGDQKRSSDFLYEDQLVNWQRAGLLTRLDLAFSRDQVSKIYVQHRMLEAASELWAWLEDGAHFYVCGDASRMARDVDAALHTIIETVGGKSAEEAKAYVARLKAEKRYQRDVY
jgi:sulfite reductase (NADPH) flavoprotein alpha-component